MKKLVIIPAFNEEGSIRKTVQDIENYAGSFDYVIINDCSTDNTMQVCLENGYNIVNLPLNMGIGGAVQTGYLYAVRHGYEIAVQFDGDGQHNAKYLEGMACELKEKKLDMLIGSRFIRKEGFQSSFLRRMGIKYFVTLIRIITGIRITDPTSGMRMVNDKVMKLFAQDYPKDYPEPESVTILLKMKLKVEEIPVVMNERLEGISSISMVKSIYYMIKVTLAICIAAMRRTGGAK